MAQSAPSRTKINTEVTQPASGRGSRPPAGPRKPGRPPKGPRVSGEARESVRQHDWLTIFRLPGYAPELNPVESVRSVLKRSLANLVKHNISGLAALAKTRLRRMHYRPILLGGSSPGPGSTSHPCVTPGLKIVRATARS